MEDRIQGLETSFELLCETTSKLTRDYCDLKRGYIDLAAKHRAALGVIIKVANEAGLNVDQILDTMNQNEQKALEDLKSRLKQDKPDVYRAVYGAD